MMGVKAKKILGGENIYLELPARKHRKAWVLARQKNHHFLQPWEPRWDRNLLTHSGYMRILSRFKHARSEWNSLIYFIMRKSDGVLVGGISLGDFNFGAGKSGKLGYWMGEEYTRCGYMTEAIAVLARHAFKDLGLLRMEAFCMASNAPSLHLLKKCNFILEGEARSYLEINGFRENHLMFSLLKQDLIDLAKREEKKSFKDVLDEKSAE